MDLYSGSTKPALRVVILKTDCQTLTTTTLPTTHTHEKNNDKKTPWTPVHPCKQTPVPRQASERQTNAPWCQHHQPSGWWWLYREVHSTGWWLHSEESQSTRVCSGSCSRWWWTQCRWSVGGIRCQKPVHVPMKCALCTCIIYVCAKIVGNWILTSCQLQRVTPEWLNSVTSKYSFQNSITSKYTFQNSSYLLWTLSQVKATKSVYTQT